MYVQVGVDGRVLRDIAPMYMCTCLRDAVQGTVEYAWCHGLVQNLVMRHRVYSSTNNGSSRYIYI